MIDYWLKDDLSQIVIATENGEIVGYYSLAEKELLKDNHDYTSWLGILFVREKHRGKHYIPILIENACPRVKNMGYEGLLLNADILSIIRTEANAYKSRFTGK